MIRITLAAALVAVSAAAARAGGPLGTVEALPFWSLPFPYGYARNAEPMQPVELRPRRPRGARHHR